MHDDFAESKSYQKLLQSNLSPQIIVSFRCNKVRQLQCGHKLSYERSLARVQLGLTRDDSMEEEKVNDSHDFSTSLLILGAFDFAIFCDMVTSLSSVNFPKPIFRDFSLFKFLTRSPL